jgi:hypothetical protein
LVWRSRAAGGEGTVGGNAGGVTGGAALADNDALLFPGQQVMYGKNIAEWTAE